jgi:UDP:flavonoid glycosyltransferase YjiC (YdhE family)
MVATARLCLARATECRLVTGVGGDQPFVAGFVQESGAGRGPPPLPNDATAADIRGTAESVLGDPSFASRAVALGAPVADLDGATLAANSVESLLAHTSQDARAVRRI